MPLPKQFHKDVQVRRYKKDMSLYEALIAFDETSTKPVLGSTSKGQHLVRHTPEEAKKDLVDLFDDGWLLPDSKPLSVEIEKELAL